MRIRAEAFYVELEEEYIYLRHPRWSLVGAGQTMPAAVEDLLSEAAAILEEFAAMKGTSGLTADALEFRDFILRFV